MLLNEDIRRITRQVLKEELTQSDVRSIVNDKVGSKDFEKKIKDIVADCMSNLFKEMYFRNSIWQSAVKK